MALFISCFKKMLLSVAIAGLLVACGATSSESEGKSVANPARVDAEKIESNPAGTDPLEDQELDAEELASTDKKSVIAYTQKNKRIGGLVGSPGGVAGLVAVDVNGLNPAESAAVAQARTALAEHLELSGPEVDAAELVEVSAQQWRNSSLGCARPGEMSAQVMTDGYRVVLVLAGLRHQVHTGRRGGRVCERLQGMLQAPRRALTLSALPRLQQSAIADLAARLEVEESEISPGRVTPGSWSDASMGCPEPGVDYAQVQTNGYFLPLIFRGRTVSYRTDGQRVVGCEGVKVLQGQDR